MPIRIFILRDASMLECLNLLWDINYKGKEYSNVSGDMKLRALDKLCECIGNTYRYPERITKSFLTRAYMLLQENNNQAFVLKFLRLCWRNITANSAYAEKREMNTKFLIEGKVIASLFTKIEKNYSEYLERAKEGKTIEADYKEETRQIKQMFLWALNESNYQITRAEIEILWKQWVVAAIFPEDQKVFYDFVRDALAARTLHELMTIQDEAIRLFTETICSEKNNYATLSFEGILAIEAYLVSVNCSLGNLKEKKKKARHNFGMSEATGSVREYLNFKVKVKPKEIKGINILWKIVLEAKNEKVTERAIDLLNRLYICLDEHQEYRICEIASEFIEIAIDKLLAFYKQLVCLLYTSPRPRDATLSRMPSSA
eukprot:TRINITY_DN3105_c0_g1_i1.p1 TRINITY_DN3105_c0_g1~~TRINITY_DN3105_c0_g1_i1.p1  ORF type:complete len:373 (-),score=75.99 TRINITY_DN3105_c0_g1_i1:2-1120(-)